MISRHKVWKDVHTFVDVGGSYGYFASQVLFQNPHLKGKVADLESLRPEFNKHLPELLKDRLTFEGLDFFKEPLPSADVICLGQVLHDWHDDVKEMLVQKAYDALPENGKLLIYDIFNDDLKKKTFSLLQSQQITIRLGGVHITHTAFQKMLDKAGFVSDDWEELSGVHDLIIAVKKSK